MQTETIRLLWSLLDGKQRRGAVILLALMVVTGFLELICVSAVPVFVIALAKADTILQMRRLQPLLAAFGIDNDIKLVVFIGVAFVVLYIARALLFLGMSRFQAVFTASTGREISARLFGRYMSAPYLFHLSRNTAQMNNVIMGETGRMVNQYLTPLLAVLFNGVMLLSLVSLLFFGNPVIAFTVGAMAAVCCYLFLRLSRKKITQHGEQLGVQNQRMTQALHEGLGSSRHIRLRNLEKPILENFNRVALMREHSMQEISFNALLPKPVFETVGIVALVGMVFIFLWQGQTPTAIMPTLALIGAVAMRVIPTLNQLAFNLAALPGNASAITAVADDLKAVERVEQAQKVEKPSSSAPMSGDIEFRNVSFRYPGQHRNAMEEVSLKIPKGSSVAFVGPTGSGKSTAVDLMLGFLPPSEGEILVGGVSIARNLPGWQSKIGYIPQAIFLTDSSVRRNVALGVPVEEIDDASVWRALEDAQVADFVRALPDGLDAAVGERGVRFSGGQRQRIGIARALYHQPEVLVLDEATAALDNTTEVRLMAAIETAKQGRTLIMIAHRLTTVRNCDQIFFIKEGRLTTSGNYDALIEKSADFQALAGVAA